MDERIKKVEVGTGGTNSGQACFQPTKLSLLEILNSRKDPSEPVLFLKQDTKYNKSDGMANKISKFEILHLTFPNNSLQNGIPPPSIKIHSDTSNSNTSSLCQSKKIGSNVKQDFTLDSAHLKKNATKANDSGGKTRYRNYGPPTFRTRTYDLGEKKILKKSFRSIFPDTVGFYVPTDKLITPKSDFVIAHCSSAHLMNGISRCKICHRTFNNLAELVKHSEDIHPSRLNLGESVSDFQRQSLSVTSKDKALMETPQVTSSSTVVSLLPHHDFSPSKRESYSSSMGQPTQGYQNKPVLDEGKIREENYSDATMPLSPTVREKNLMASIEIKVSKGQKNIPLSLQEFQSQSTRERAQDALNWTIPLTESSQKEPRAPDNEWPDISGKTCAKSERESNQEKQDLKKEEILIPTYFKCAICSEIFEHMTGLQIHLKFHSLKNLRVEPCLRCNIKFTHVAEKILHDMIHEHLLDFLTKNSQCGTETPGKKDVKPVWEIMKSLDTDDIMQFDFFMCSVCNMIYSKAYNALKHKLYTHPTQNLLKCPMCSYQAVDGNNFFSHLSLNTNRTKVICPVLSCQSSFSLEEDFYLHIERSHKISCNICGESFDREAAYRRHRYKMHVTECVKCKLTFDKPIDCMRHRQRVHNGGKDITSIACKVCGKEFKRRVHYATHLRIHFDYLRLPCKVCQKTFQTQQGLNNHMRVHTQEKPFLCNICGKSFAHASSFSAHMKKEREKAVESNSGNQL